MKRRLITLLTMISAEGFPPGVTVGYAKSQVKDILKAEFNKSVELQVNSTPVQMEGKMYACVSVCVKEIFGGNI